MTFGGSYTEGQADAGLQSTNPDLQNSQESFRSRYVQGAFTVDDVEQAMRDVRINLEANLPGPPDEPPPPYTTGTYFEDGGRLVQSAGGTPQQNKPLTVNQYFVHVNVQKGNVQVGSDNVHIGNDDVTSSAGKGNKQTQDVKTSPSTDSKDGRIRNDEEEEDEECIIEGEIIEEEEEGNDLMSGFSEEKKVTGPEKNDTETEEATSSDDKAKEETADSSIAGSADDTDGVVNNTKLSEEDQVSNGAAASSSVSSTTPKMGSKMEYEKLELRDYQEELAKPAFDGHNCIICAPTGTGKTHVAMAITKHCFVESLAEQAQSNGGDVTFKRKAIFLVHRIPLLNQTYKRFKRHLPLLNIAKRSGASMTNTGFEMLVPVNDMIITTGGILKNSLTEKKVTLDEFSLIIIDECHHAMKNHPYNVIMAEYLRLKLSNPTTKLPQIIGLTASPGSGSKSGLKTATDHILKLCANMDAHMFVTVKDEKNKKSLGKVTNDPDKYTSVTDPRKPDPFKEKVEEIMVESRRELV
ncbi:interferon-induced helicase C domain-containing protein 1-like isoform X2 [Ptychodera flava]